MYLSKVTKYLYFVTFHHCVFIQQNDGMNSVWKV